MKSEVQEEQRESMRYIIYQQGARGLGKITRNIKLVKVINDFPYHSCGILITGDFNISYFDIPESLEIVKIPEIYKGLNKQYTSKNLNIELTSCLKLRSEIIKTIIINFQPDVFFVDTIPTGVLNELKELIIWLKNSTLTTKIILTTRDVIDSPAKTIEEWRKFDIYNFIEKYYDFIFIFGCVEIFDFCKEYKLSKRLTRKTIYCNYFSKDYLPKNKLSETGKFDILITLGGGIDGFNLIKIFLKNYHINKSKESVLIVLGKQFPLEQFKKQFFKIPAQITILEFSNDLVQLYQSCKVVICMGGYNTITELLCLGIYPYVFPREKPTQEQLVRCENLQRMDLLNIINENDLRDLGIFETYLNKNNIKPSNLIKFNLSEILEQELKKILEYDY